MALSSMITLSYMVFIWKLDRNEPEDPIAVFAVFAWGALGATFLGCSSNLVAELIAQVFFSAETTPFMTAAVLAPITEETAKGLVFFIVVISNVLDNETDGLVYGAATGLGFAFTENLLYFFGGMGSAPGEFLTLISIRTLCTTALHGCSSALLGLAVGYAKRHGGGRLWLRMVPLGLLAGIVNHGLWNAGMLGASEAHNESASLTTFFLALLVLIGATATLFVVGALSVRHERRIILRYLTVQSLAGLLPPEYIPYLVDPGARKRKGWFQPERNRKVFIHDAIKLAFRMDYLAHKGVDSPLKDPKAKRLASNLTKLLRQSA